MTHDPELVRATGRLLVKMTPAQLAKAEIAAEARGMLVAEYVRERLARRIVGAR